jgi:hypothetical protein
MGHDRKIGGIEKRPFLNEPIEDRRQQNKRKCQGQNTLHFRLPQSYPQSTEKSANIVR